MYPVDPVSWARSGCIVLASVVDVSTKVPPLTATPCGALVGGGAGADGWHAASSKLAVAVSLVSLLLLKIPKDPCMRTV
jgi:hypothetical protein